MGRKTKSTTKDLFGIRAKIQRERDLRKKYQEAYQKERDKQAVILGRAKAQAYARGRLASQGITTTTKVVKQKGKKGKKGKTIKRTTVNYSPRSSNRGIGVGIGDIF